MDRFLWIVLVLCWWNSLYLFVQAGESIAEELQVGMVCKRRLEHLKEHGGSSAAWRRRRLDRMLVEYFLRRGYYNAAQRLAHTSDLGDLTNIGEIPGMYHCYSTYKSTWLSHQCRDFHKWVFCLFQLLLNL